MTPKISIILNTKENLYPIRGLDVDIFSLLYGSLKEQTFRDIELITVDHFWKERKDEIGNYKLPFPYKYIPPKPTYWDSIPVAPQISSFRNSGLMFARSKLVMCMDDCIFMENNRTLEQIWWWFENYGMVLRPILDFRHYHNTEHVFDRDPDSQWIENIPDGLMFKELNAHRGGVFCYPVELYMQLNGFDERFDGGWGSEDCNWSKRVDMFGVKRFVLSNGQHRFTYCTHSGRKLESIGVRCNESYAQWMYRGIDDLDLVANSRILTEEDISKIDEICMSESCPPFKLKDCKKEKKLILDHFRKYQPVFNLRELRGKMLVKHGDRNGAFNPW